jgi:hypothetical protein
MKKIREIEKGGARTRRLRGNKFQGNKLNKAKLTGQGLAV